MASSPASSSIALFFLLVLQVITSETASSKTCPISQCSPNGPDVRFPFWIRERQGEECGHKGFEVSCDDRSRTILHMSEAGDFIVDAIDYGNQTVLVKDPDDCLPRRLLEDEFVSSYSPFPAPAYKNFTFGNCSSEYSSLISLGSGVQRVDCLNLGRGSMVVVSVADDDLARLWMSQHHCGTWTALIPWWWQPPTSLGESIWLRWDDPDCKTCEAADGRCVLQDSKKGPKLVCAHKHALSTSAQFAIASLFMLPWLTCIFGFIWFLKVRVFVHRRLDQISSNGVPGSAPPNGINGEAVEIARRNAIGVMGIDSSTIESYPKTQIDDLGQLPRPHDDVCAICLSKYERNEMIRTIPECEHYFHMYCIDQWLRKNASCPLCRNNKGHTNAEVASS